MAADLPKTFKATVFQKPLEPLTIEDVELKQPIEGEVLIKVICCGVCHSDSGVREGLLGSPYPIIPGHEVVGDVVALGPGEKTWKIGDRVGGTWHGGHDGTCKSCKRGLFQYCINEAINGVSRNGGYAEYCNLRTEAAVPISKELDPAATCPLLCAGTTVFNGMKKMQIDAGGIVAIQGLGGLGHLAVQYASKMGYRTVALSHSADKKDFAYSLGAHDYIDSSQEDQAEALQKLGGAAMIDCTAPNPNSMGQILHGLAPGGKLLVIAPVGDISLDTATILTKAISAHGWPSGHALDCEEAIEFAQVHHVNVMIERFPLADAEKAFQHMVSGHVRFRAVLTMT